MSSKNKILLVEDDKNFGAVMQSYLKMNDFIVDWVDDGKDAFAEFRNDQYDLCILDVMLPNVDGFSIAKDIREANENVPIIFLTAKTLKKDIIEGFQSGADDYITKPFDSELLLLKINAILKRKTKQEVSEKNEYQIGKYYFNSTERILKCEEESFKLSPKEAKLLKLLCIHINTVMNRNIALMKIWGENSYFTTRSMDVYITKLRKYLKYDTNISLENIHGSGFCLKINN